mmetsp:Transcript_38689/g.61310  ORF Transcript_38689/g.61310 Transcript_38689/m.61310 type:complete len:111 (-) Transcript_38689:106-438(-)|eukprot:CAMPEP_0201526010 /NCGR_PEP_ID=MMETSP0161_2-20130828/30297_1 /ASSEMBLY_ACC=CAM_ASM_000251 /TAXON_ID=180227 /ORGANISM="Neoparamoeba aestuarina, Strain SoJaBio B1-5/56/2" /LENGTH=110 /DNA_ID=CAMNT_0047926199 /DNA_START=147 /DNA_END=479 /DNA_ORIENTATION=-
MDNLIATPRINGAMFPTYVNQGTVRVVGQVNSVNGEQVQLNCSDGVVVNALIRGEVDLPINSVIEVTGKITEQQVLEDQGTVTFYSTGFDFPNYDAVVQLTHKYRSLFYE